jgi:hypothetical protein
MVWIHAFLDWVGERVCAMGWHREPYVKQPRPRGMTPEQYEIHERYGCSRCGLVGRLDNRGNLEPLILHG